MPNPSAKQNTEVWQGTLSLMILKTLEAMGPQHGYGIARRIEQTSNDLLRINYGTLYPQLRKLEREGHLHARWGVSEKGQKARFYRLTSSGRRRARSAEQEWKDAHAIVSRFLAPEASP